MATSQNSTRASEAREGRSFALLGIVVFLNGAAILALEILGSRLVAPTFGNTLHVWSGLIAVTLGGLSLGYAWGGLLADRAGELRKPLGLALAGGGAAILADGALAALVPGLAPLGFQAGPLAAALLLLFLPSLLLGTVLPLAIRLATREMGHLGRRVGGLYALATLGSIAGALAVAFLLVPLLSVRHSLLLLGLLPLALGFVLLGPRVLPLLLLGVGLHLAAAPASPPGTLHERDTPYAHLQVVERGGSRHLLLDSILQGGARPDGSPSSPYLLALGEALASRPDAGRVLVLGLGSGAGPGHFRNFADEVEVVELDPGVAEAARRFFPDGYRLHLGDGRSFLRTAEEEYDAVVVDVYAGASVPVHMATREFALLVRERLRPGGLLLANLLGSPEGSGSAFWRAVARTYGDLFSNVGVRFLSPGGAGNILVAASEGDLPPGFNPADPGEGPLLTDDHAPVEAMQAPVIEELYRNTRAWLWGK